MDSTIDVRYFPKTEASIFGVVSVICIAGVYLLSLSAWFVVGLIFIAYIVTLAGTTMVAVNNEELKITSMNPFKGSHTVAIKSITKIKALDVLPDGDTRTSFSLFTRTLEVQYLDEATQKDIVHFSIYNKDLEKKVLKALRKLTKKEKVIVEEAPVVEEGLEDETEVAD